MSSIKNSFKILNEFKNSHAERKKNQKIDSLDSTVCKANQNKENWNLDIRKNEKFEEKVVTVMEKQESIKSNILKCRFCLDSNSDEGEFKLIYPCLCEGSSKYIHDKCLRNWIMQKYKDPNQTILCEICNYPYRIEYKFKLKPHIIRNIICNLLSLIIIELCIFTIIYVIVSNFVEDNVKFYITLGLSLFFFTFSLIMLIGYYKKVKSCNENHIIEKWGVLNFQNK